MPWTSFKALTDDDAYSVALYLKSLDSVDNQVLEPVSLDGTATAPYLTTVVPGEPPS